MAQHVSRVLTVADLSGNPRRRRNERIIKGLFVGAAGLSIVISAAIVLSLFIEALTFLRNVDWPTLWDPRGWFPRRGAFDLRTIIVGTAVVAVIAGIVATPLGLGAAMYLSEYAKPRHRRWLKPILEVLASIPSVVLGFFAILWINPNLVQRIWSDASFFNMACAGVAVGVLVTPLVATVAEDAMKAVPMALREAAFGMGARKRTVSLNVVAPAAISGIVASLIIGISRAIGETMIVAIAAGGTGGSSLTFNPAEQGQTMTAAMTALAVGSDQVRGTEGTFESLFFVGLLLFFITLALNTISERFVRRVREKY